MRYYKISDEGETVLWVTHDTNCLGWSWQMFWYVLHFGEETGMVDSLAKK